MYIFIRLVFIFIFLSAAQASPAQNTNAKQNPEDSSIIKTKVPSSPKEIVIKYGIASFYAEKFHGRKTANGNIYSSQKFTAACNVLPLDIWIKVTNLKNGKSVIVYVNDRLHPKNNRLVDLSRVAAEKLGFISRGITKVKVEVLGKLKKGKI